MASNDGGGSAAVETVGSTAAGGGEGLTASLPGRAAEIATLQAFLGTGDTPQAPQPIPGAIFVYGSAATGKSAVVNRVLAASGIQYAAANCVEVLSPRVLFERILTALAGQRPSRATGYGAPMKCDSFNAFVLQLETVLSERPDPNAACVIVLDDADRLRALSPELLAGLLRISELVTRPVSVVLVSRIVWEKFRTGTGCTEPLLVHFPAYGKEATLRIIGRDCPVGEDSGFFGAFVDLLWGVFNGPCRDLSELRHLVALLFPRYLQPVLSGEVRRDQTMVLYKRVAPHLKKQLSRLYLRETSSSDWIGELRDQDRSGPAGSKTSGEMELPYLSKYLLIAAYLASYNPASTDVRVFAKRQGKRRVKKRGGAMKAFRKTSKTKRPQHLLGPKTFPLDRLLAIFYSIIETRIDASSEIHTQVASLVTLRLLAQTSSADNLEAPKFKCLVGLHDVQKVASTLGCNVNKYVFEAGT